QGERARHRDRAGGRRADARSPARLRRGRGRGRAARGARRAHAARAGGGQARARHAAGAAAGGARARRRRPVEGARSGARRRGHRGGGGGARREGARRLRRRCRGRSPGSRGDLGHRPPAADRRAARRGGRRGDFRPRRAARGGARGPHRRRPRLRRPDDAHRPPAPARARPGAPPPSRHDGHRDARGGRAARRRGRAVRGRGVRRRAAGRVRGRGRRALCAPGGAPRGGARRTDRGRERGPGGRPGRRDRCREPALRHAAPARRRRGLAVVARLVGAALRHRAAVFLMAAGLVVGGLYAARTAPLDVFPEFAPPIVEVQVEAPGLAPEDVEALVTRPLERALGGAPEVATLRSSSIAGLAVVTAVYHYGTDPYRARQVVIERLALTAEQLPAGTRPAVSPLSAALSTILAIGLRAGPEVSPLELRDMAEWTIRPRLLAVPGVANVVIYGGGIRQVQLTTTPERLWAAGVTLDDLAAAAGAGFLARGGQRLPTWLDARLRSPADLARAPLPGRDSVPVSIAAVADVGEGPAVPVGDATVNGEPGVLLLVIKQPEMNVLAVTAEVEAALRAVVRALPAGVRVEESMFRQASFVTHALGNLRRALLAGVVLVIVVLVLFTGSQRAALVSVVAIPLSLLAAVAVLRAAGATLNVMVLGGLAIAVGEVVDDAIIDVENAWRRLRAAPAGARAADVVLAASVEVRSAVVYATVMVALVFLPVFLLGGLEGALFRPLATAYVLATLASLVVALTVTPALAAVLLPGAVARRTAPPWLLSALRARYERALGAALARPAPVIAGSVAALAAALALTPLLRLEFLPEFHETNFVMHMTGAPGVGLDESARVGAATARTLLAVPGVRSVAQVIGRSTLSEDAFGPERSEMMVQLEPGADAVAVT